MSRASGPKACKTCAVAKRKCGRQKPQCLRCRRLNVPCIYPPSKPSSYVLIPDDEDAITIGSDSSATAAASRESRSSTVVSTLPQPHRFDPANFYLALDLQDSPIHDGQDLRASAPPSWFQNIPGDLGVLLPIQKADLDTSAFDNMKHHMAIAKEWLARWVDKGSNPFIHPQLYKRRLPVCIQDAYTSVASYLRKNQANEQMIYRIIEDRVRNLVEGHPKDPPALDSIDSLGRVQALLIYQIIGLFDGDLRLRHVAEGYIQTLYEWAANLEPLARYPLWLGDLNGTSGTHVSTTGVYEASDVGSSTDGSWMSWIIAESMNRTWTLVAGIQGVYKMIQQSRSHRCSVVGMMMTARKGLWDAPSAPAWDKICAERYIGFIFLSEVETLFTKFTYDEVDEFTIMTLGTMFGLERIERWRLRPAVY
ncbi:unnamed protein product [Clonostachys rhizophaga]|uniref:Zn(2)-C6 fungal-type domain-containing protein n=1 Tax=Clonostachys rhizophaga TaxID=160324 RepID=A0A9N9YU79_9HYPO|nr:unnamed protein product [Clonostachys rhizophaga]